MTLRSLTAFSFLSIFGLAGVTACGSSPSTTPLGTGGAGTSTGGTSSGGTEPMGGAAPLPVDGENPTAVEAAQGMGKGFNLGQMFESTQHPRTVAAATAKIDAYYARGFRNVRIPITWTEQIGGDMLVKDPTTGEVDREHARLKVITEVVDYALSLPDLYVVINTHHEHALKTEARAAVLERLWGDIAEIFSDRSHRLIYEFINEPHKEDPPINTPMAPADVRLMTGLAYNKVRAIDDKRIVVIGGNRWFAAEEVPAVWTSLEEVGGGADPYVMATFHHYNPWTFCGERNHDEPWTDSQLTSPMETMLQWSNTVGGGMPFFIGEWGVDWQSTYQTMDCNNIRHWYSSFSEQSTVVRGIPTSVWDDGGWFRVFDHATGEFDNNLIDCMTGVCEWQGTERMNAACGEP